MEGKKKQSGEVEENNEGKGDTNRLALGSS